MCRNLEPRSIQSLGNKLEDAWNEHATTLGLFERDSPRPSQLLTRTRSQFRLECQLLLRDGNDVESGTTRDKYHDSLDADGSRKWSKCNLTHDEDNLDETDAATGSDTLQNNDV